MENHDHMIMENVPVKLMSKIFPALKFIFLFEQGHLQSMVLWGQEHGRVFG